MELRGIKVLLKDTVVETPISVLELCPQIKMFFRPEENLLVLEQLSF